MSLESTFGHVLSSVGTYLWRDLIAIDQLGNALIGGQAGETISSETGRTGLGSWLDKALNLAQKDHSLIALEYTPYGVFDAHNAAQLDDGLAHDFDCMIQVLSSPHWSDEGFDPATFFEPVTLASAERAMARTRVFVAQGRMPIARARIERELYGYKLLEQLCGGQKVLLEGKEIV